MRVIHTFVAATAVALASTALAENLRLNATLDYTTVGSCKILPPTLGDQNLAATLLPGQVFHGRMHLQQTNQEKEACNVQLVVEGDVQSVNATAPFDALTMLDAQLANAVKASLQGAVVLPGLQLQRIQVQLHDRDYSLDLHSAVDHPEVIEQASIMKLSGPCDEILEQDDILEQLLPAGTMVKTVEMIPSASDAVNCGVGMDIAAGVPAPEGTDNAFGLLQALDDNFNAMFGSGDDTPVLGATTIRLNAVAVPTAVNLAAHNANTPTKSTMLGMLVGVTTLCAMLFYVNYKRNSVDKRCQERFEKASRAAQIRRVSYSMGYDRVANRELMMDEEEEEVKEEKEDLI